MNLENPKVSVIMGIYNCEKTLSNAIDSVINQSYKNWELIMCDDCSTDNTLKIANRYNNKYNNIKVITNKENKGLAFSLNKCLENSTGYYIARMDSDDICFKERFKVQVDFLNNNIEYQVVGSSMVLFDEYGEKGIRHLMERPTKEYIIKNNPHAHPTIMMRREAYMDLNGYTISDRTRKGQDLDLWFRFYSKGFRGYNIQQPLLKYHESINDYKKRSVKSAIGFMKTMYIGYKINNISIYKYIYILKPLISALIPNKIMYRYHKINKEKLK
ncbi:glycosyltransferase family 2 protein [Clostridium perfringens]|uniref:glycosyltransferase family 2 protein n=1 Tax=Clostridium perfringens TaxID=1502 RepID=UPI000D70AB16|nr:glycosyltransferase [Clostridium perfringens]MDK0680098.1 glycosyltransferase [Clostridium perfringens]MDK0781470.1 glycosyltransferase [Clostridium perfringens]MDK0858274.1 glycosyltransferase [Clostridium perfringens]MDM0559256.1 glycosyltransferase [Clostridium perfringens]MDM0590397.1 glycosyltransferase [Clostridium perfringens]